MPRIALISDVHGNLDALIAVLRDIDQAAVDCLVCLGDVVGYGPDPASCVDLVNRVCDVVLMGNHDEAALLEEPPANFNPTAAASLRITRSLLEDRHFETIGQWPMRSEFQGVHLTHASFGRRVYAYVQNRRFAAESFDGLVGALGAFGHTHIPSMFALSSDGQVHSDFIRGCLPLPSELVSPLPVEHRIIINPGSVGQPRDRNPDASWGLLDTSERTFCAKRVAYDINNVERKIRERGLPHFLHERLRVGA